MAGASKPPTILHVQVVDDLGQPIMEASVLFKEAPVSMPDIAALTNDSGWVVLAAPIPGTYTLEAVAAGFQNETATIDVGERDEELIEIVLTLSANGN